MKSQQDSPDTMRKFLALYAGVPLTSKKNGKTARRFAGAVMCLWCGLVGAFYASIFAIHDADGLKAAWLLCSAWALVFFLPFVMKYRFMFWMQCGAALLFFVFVSLTYLFGTASGFHLFLIPVLLTPAITLGVKRRALVWGIGVATVFTMIICIFLFQEAALGALINPTLQLVLAASVLMWLVPILISGVVSLSTTVSDVEAALDLEHARSESLLHNLLPQDIATQLKDRPGEVIADRLPAITVLFADIVDFTQRSAKMPAEELVTFLNQIFSTFDVLTEAHGLEKIKTIGDAYMVAAGLPDTREDHAEVIADMALAMLAETTRLSNAMGTEIKLRIGISSGPAVAGVIGTNKVFYDVWGDTVNMASRMESYGEPNSVQVTSQTKALLRESFVFVPRGLVDIKGIGAIETFWLKNKVAEVSKSISEAM